jgi:hypothetical protein
MRRSRAFGTIVLLILNVIFVEFATSESAAPTSAEVMALLQASGAADIAAQLGPLAAQQLSLAFHRANPALSLRADAVITDVVVTYMRQMAERDQVVDRLIPIYAKYLTKDDIRQITEFYRSPAGRKLVSVMPAISVESAKVGQEWMESILPGLQAELLRRLKSEKLIE